ncbi:zinc-dependent metalloprotease family protein [soil metagenome]
MKKLTLLLVFSCTFFSSVNAQKKYWSPHTGNAPITIDKAAARSSFPKNFKLFDLDIVPLKSQLFSVVSNTTKHTTVISVPDVDGNLEQFEVTEASNFDPVLQARFPDIRAFSGRGISDKYATLKLSISPQGIQTMVFRTEKDNEFIESYSQNQGVYAVFTSQRSSGKLPWSCTTVDDQLATGISSQLNKKNIAARSGADLKTMRLAQSVTAEYSNYFGATSASQVALVLAGINATLTRCNGVYEKDLALHLNLVAASTNVIYYNAATDPYDNASTGAGGTWNAQLQSTLTSVIGEANYDIGHLFGASGGGGNAGCIGCICTNGSKGSGFTSPADAVPQGDNFDIDYVTHEVGHQLGANHTFSFNNEGTGVNKEIGSGITIMGYAGITPQDVAGHSIDIFHETSIAQIQANLATKSCPVTTAISNATPAVNSIGNFTIPKSTPFALTGSASDANSSDVLTYCWEQNDNASSSQTGNNSRASATKATGPNWISFRPTTSPTRYFPQLSTILAGGTTTGPMTGGDAGVLTEALSSVARTLNFRLTVRDNAPYSSTSPISVGQTQFSDVVVTVSSASGPFAVTAPNTVVNWAGGSTQTITWSVASTTVAPVSCANVKISLSTDGGQTFPTVLIASTPNDGTAALTIPNTPTTTARIKIEAVGNIFFDISNTNFTITSGSSCGTPTGLASSAITTSGATISWTAVSGATSYAVDYKLNSASTWTSFSTAQTGTSANLSGLTSSSLYDWRVTATCASGTSSPAAAQFTTATPATCNAPTGLSSSVTTSTATLSWAAASGAVSYAVDYKLNTASTWTSFSTAQTGLSANITGLSSSTLYNWRVTTNCASGSSTAATANFTTSTASTCVTAFEPNETQAAAIAISSGVANTAAISTSTDIDYYKITTTATSNIAVNLAGPSGVDYDLYIYNSSGTQLGAGESGTATESVSLSGQAAGTYYIKVIGYNGANSSTCYLITATATATTATGCQSDYDVSTNGTISGAAVIPFNTNITGLISPSGDIDDYKFTITTAGSITISLSTLPKDYDLKLLNSGGTQVGISQNGSTTSESITYTAAAGTYYAQVYGYRNANSATACYTLKVTLGTATRIGDITNTGSEKKMLSVYPNPAQTKININLTGYKGVAEMKLFDVNGRVVSVARTPQINSAIDISKLARGVYMLKIITSTGEVLNTKVVKQ